MKVQGQEEYSTRIIRWMSKPLTSLILWLNPDTSPNYITIISLLMALNGIIIILNGNIYVGTAFIFLYILLDASDGDIARIQKSQSIKGKWMDSNINFIVPTFTLIALAYNLNYLHVGIWAAIAYPMHFLVVFYYKFDIQRTNKPIGNIKSSFIRFIYGGIAFYFILLFGVAFNHPELVLWFYATAGNLYWVLMLFIQYRGFKDDLEF